MKLIFIVNQQSGNGKGAKTWRNIESKLTVPYEVYVTTYEKQAIELAKNITAHSNALKEPVLLIGIGGDGTYHELLNGIQDARYITLGAVCAGSGNDFKRAYGEFESAEQIEAFLQSPEFTKHDAGYLQADEKQYYFVNNSGIGFDALVAITANESKVKKMFNKMGLGKLCYVYYLVKCLFSFKPFSLQLEVNGQTKSFQNVWFVTASNQPFFGGGMKISPASNTTDGKLELTVVHNLNKYKLLFIFITVFLGKHTMFKEVEQMAANSFTIHMDSQTAMHADGEKLLIQTMGSTICFTAKQNHWRLAKMK